MRNNLTSQHGARPTAIPPATPLTLLAALLEEARTFFEDRGTHGLEGTAMIKSGNQLSLVIPRQNARRDAHGHVEVAREGQMDLALALGPDELYLARIHSHPDAAFHSGRRRRQPGHHLRGRYLDRRPVLRPRAAPRPRHVRRLPFHQRRVDRAPVGSRARPLDHRVGPLMGDDPRLRLLGAPSADTNSNNAAAAVLQRLDETEVHITVDAAASPAARIAVAAFVTMIARLVSTLTIESDGELPPNWWQADS